MANDAQPHIVDLHVGARLRLRRRSLGMSQTTLGQAAGLTFQQLQKYERGANRISASKLQAMAQTLGVPAAWLFEGLPDTLDTDPNAPADSRIQAARSIHAFFMSHEGLELARLFPTLPAGSRTHVLALIKTLADAESRADGEGAGET